MRSNSPSVKNKGHITSGNVYRTRVISSNTWVNGESAAWRSDYYKFKGFIFAQVLKKSQQRWVPRKLHLKPKSDSNMHCPIANNVYSNTNSIDQNKKLNNKVTNGGLTDKKTKVGGNAKEFQLPCSNRFDVLYQGDGVVMRHSNPNMSNVHVDQESVTHDKCKEGSSLLQIHEILGASKNDASNNPGKRVRSEVETQEPSTHKVSTDLNIHTYAKYDLSLRLKDKKLDYTTMLASSPTFQLWNKQNETKFGFIPMGKLEVPDKVSPSKINADPLTLHKIIKASREYNYKQCQIPIKSQLNPEVWEEQLKGYWDVQLPLFIKYGFPLDFDMETPLESHYETIRRQKTIQKM